ncbi:MAG: urease accessory protein UreD [Betaproteobacteria bacterium]|nr:urease accessory protein UreD [Betaproteobacteria bacterium]
MKHGEPLGWQAELDLHFACRGEGTVLARRRHSGPLAVQKPLYPEGEAVCHVIVLHPPAGIAGGDALDIGIEVGEGAQALLTTPGAGKWYRSDGRRASQDIEIKVSPGGTAEWLPQETIVFDGARAAMRTRIELAAGARYFGWEILCLGRSASGERFARGSLRLATRIVREGRLLWAEQGALEGGSPWLDSPAGFAGCTVSATLLAAGAPSEAALIAACREVGTVEGARCGVTALPDLVVARWLGDSGEAARDWLEGLWRHLRPAFVGREAQRPRIWNT